MSAKIVAPRACTHSQQPVNRPLVEWGTRAREKRKGLSPFPFPFLANFSPKQRACSQANSQWLDHSEVAVETVAKFVHHYHQTTLTSDPLFQGLLSSNVDGHSPTALWFFFSKKAVRGSIDLQRRLNLPVPVTGAAETPAEAAVIFPSRIQSTFDFLELKSGLLDIRLLEVNFQLRVGLQKVEKGMYNPNFRSQLG